MKYLTAIVLMWYITASLAEVAPTILMGLESGEMLSCNFKDVTDCSTLSEQDSPVNSLVVSGEFVYTGLQSGELRRCRNNKPSNCTLFHEFLSEINGLAISGKYIYVASNDEIFKCGLRKSEDCTSFHQSDTPLLSLAILGDNLYVGTEEGIIYCPLKSSTNCTEAFNTTSAVTAMSVFSKYIYVGSKEGSVQRCTQDDNGTDCSDLFEVKSAITSLDIFDEHVLISLDTGDIKRFNLDNDDETLTISRNESTVLSMFTMYATTRVKKDYVGESADCVWQFMSCPPYVVYYDIEARSPLELRVKDGKLYTIKDELFHTGGSSSHWRSGAIFVIDPAGKIYASNQHPIMLLHHSSLMAGSPVAAAGELIVSRGVIETVTTCSGHYRPSSAYTPQITSALRRQGYEGNITVKDCFRLDLMIDLDYQKTDLYYKVKYEEYSRKMKQIDNY